MIGFVDRIINNDRRYDFKKEEKKLDWLNAAVIII